MANHNNNEPEEKLDPVSEKAQFVQEKFSSLFAGYGAFAARHPGILIGFSLFFALLCFAGVAIVEDRDTFEPMWLLKDGTASDSLAALKDSFGGNTREQSIIVGVCDSGSSCESLDGNALSADALAAVRHTLFEVLTEDEEGQSNSGQVFLSSPTGRADGTSRRYTGNNFCERPTVPRSLLPTPTGQDPFTSVGTLSYAYQQLTECVNSRDASVGALPSGWGIERFPCKRTTVLDCFKEGNLDYPVALKQLDTVAAAVADNSNTAFCIASLKSTFAGALGNEVQAEALGDDLTELVATFRNWGYSWRQPYTGMTPANVSTYLSSVEPEATTAQECRDGSLNCCLTWAGEWFDVKTVVSSDFDPASGASASASSLKSTIFSWNKDHPTFIDSTGLAVRDDRASLISQWENVLGKEWKSKYDRDLESRFGPGEDYGTFKLLFTVGNSLDSEVQKGDEFEVALIAVGYILVALYMAFTFAKFSQPYTIINLVYSRVFLAFAGVLSIAIAATGSFGLIAVLQIKISPYGRTIVPLLLLAIGSGNVYVLSHSLMSIVNERTVTHRLKIVLGRNGITCLASSVAVLVAVGSGTYVRIPGTEELMQQLFAAVLLNTFMLFTFFVPMMALDAKRSALMQTDCCVPPCTSVGGWVPVENHESMANKGEFLNRFSRNKCGPILSSLVGKVVVIVLFIGAFIAFAFFAFHDPTEGIVVSDTITDCNVAAYWEEHEARFGVFNTDVFTSTSSVSFTTAQALATATSSGNVPSAYTDSWLNGKNGLFTFNTAVSSGTFSVDFAAWTTVQGFLFSHHLYCQTKLSGSFVDCANFNSDNHVLRAARVPTVSRPLPSLRDKEGYVRVSGSVSGKNGVSVSGFALNYFEQFENGATNLVAFFVWAFVAVMCTMIVSQFSLFATSLSVLFLAITSIELWGLLSMLDINVNALSTSALAIGVGCAGHVILHVVHKFMSHEGSLADRTTTTVTRSTTPVVNYGVSFILAVLPLTGAKYEFVEDYFGKYFICVAVVIVLNGVFLLPVILSIFGPKPHRGRYSHNSIEMQRIDSVEVVNRGP